MVLVQLGAERLSKEQLYAEIKDLGYTIEDNGKFFRVIIPDKEYGQLVYKASVYPKKCIIDWHAHNSLVSIDYQLEGIIKQYFGIERYPGSELD